ncbi:hypothetical protein [Desulforamulus aeronauticus]|uniref:Uncharacterized protein n=1 Tax=Desulforamulus aeronauticus DSM 10349 TaxID=1121421 RepID=A0A1M6UNC4_9FIRM|nr:hypothetical protein [Desulforamulus aeronauticus]SHK70704.1 hypothetical protein SAMN02745123_02838 [Desulforamulus aeronauticus DSM 10349]
MTEKNSALDEQRAADRKVRKQDYMVISLGIVLLLVAKIMA